MSYVVLARKWRPQKFSDLVGQEPIVRTLTHAIELGRLSHAVVFSGTRGVGKTTTARLLAKALNCENVKNAESCGQCSNCKEIAAGTSVDVREIDGASNALVEDIRELIDNVRYSPAKSKHKIYIVDEVHMLSKSAFNALLKTLEEPPSGVQFIFATTEPHKIPDTILSRCQRFDFRQVSEDQITRHLRTIVNAEKIVISDGALALLARQSDGSLRDSLSLLDQVIAFGGESVSDDDVAATLGLCSRELIAKTLEALVNHDAAGALMVLSEVLERGFDPKNYLSEVWQRVRDLLVLKAGADERLVLATEDEKKRLKGLLQGIDEAELTRWFDLFKGALGDVARSEFPRYVMEVVFLKATRNEERIPLAILVEKLEALEKKSPGIAPVLKTIPEKKIVPVLASAPDWDQLVTHMKRQKPAWAAILLQANHAGFQEDRLVLTFEEGSFYASRAKDADFETHILALATELFGSTYRLDIKTEAKKSSKEPASASKDRLREREALEHPVIQKALSMFEAKIEDIKPIK